MQQEDGTSIVFTQNGAWQIPVEKLTHLRNSMKPIARTTKTGTYVCETPNITGKMNNDTNTGLIGRTDVTQRNKALSWHQR